MKKILIYSGIVIISALNSCSKSGGESAPVTPPINNNGGSTSGGNTGGGSTPIIKNIFANGGSIVFTNGLPTTFKFTSNEGKEISLIASGNTKIEIVNEELGTATVVNVSAGSTISYSNIVNSNKILSSEEIAALYGKTSVFIKVPLDKSKYGVDEVDVFLQNDGTYKAGQINTLGNLTQMKASDVDGLFKQASLTPSKIVL